MARSNKPIVWGLFAVGGTVTAFLVPALIVVLGLAVPFELLSPNDLSFKRVYGIVAHPLGRIILFGFITVSFWHAAHRTRTTVHDLGINNDGATMLICYGVGGLGTVLSAVFLLLL